MWNLKHVINEPICETETELQTYRTNWKLPEGRRLGEGWSGRLGSADVSFCIKNGETARSYCVVQETVFKIL